MKRTFDFVICLTLLPLCVLLCLIVLPLVYVDTRASPLFVQTRVGRDGHPFRLLKLRTMRADTLHVASHEVGRAQITRSGRWLRRLKIDELPQIANVLAGSMSLVGPRPCLPVQEILIAERSRRGVLALRPGITGPAQVAGVDMSTPERLVELDAQYLGPWSLWRDLALLFATATGKGRGDAATRIV
ncbi:sugar transferase [uncultured Sphingomonas sp.]|uniref:sugar transferase n=1 Tax=uncultured Sphingomonas sp. TaxID=158754 RepID=UPI002593B0F1|nr:sugar transferase [uncultured Sphingomonas sp.]